MMDGLKHMLLIVGAAIVLWLAVILTIAIFINIAVSQNLPKWLGVAVGMSISWYVVDLIIKQTRKGK